YLEFNEAYSQRWNGQNLWMERSLDGFLSQGYQHGDAVVTPAELEASPYYRNFLKPLDIRYGLGISIGRPDSGDVAGAACHRDQGDAGSGDEGIALVEMLRPRLANVNSIIRRIAAADAGNASLKAFYDHARVGMVTLDVDANLLRCNAGAEAIFARLDCVQPSQSSARAFRAPVRRVIALAVNQAMSGRSPFPVSIRIDGRAAEPGSGAVLHVHPM